MDKTKIVKHCQQYLLAVVIAVLPATALAQDKVDDIIDTGIKRTDKAKASQGRIDKIADQTDKLFSRYKRELKVIDGLKVYNALLQRQLDDQVATMQDLNDSIDEVAVIERQITPLMLRMVEGLERFIALDVPFLMKERRDRVQRLKDAIGRADVTAAEKFRSVIEAYQVEMEYGRTIEAYADLLEIDGQSRKVNVLRYGRISLVYQTDGGEHNGAWNQSARQWEALDSAEYRNHIATGLKIAGKKVPADLTMLPVSAAEGK